MADLSRTRIEFKFPVFLALSCVLTFSMVGCGGGADKGTVSGKVTYNGSPVPGGNVILHPANGGPDFPLPIDHEGNFNSTGVPPGEMQVSIETEYLKNQAQGYEGKNPIPPAGKVPTDVQRPQFDTANMPKYMKIPGKYANTKTSGLTWTIKDGKNEQNFELTDN